jgi:putrescine transport system ATP-binding protein
MVAAAPLSPFVEVTGVSRSFGDVVALALVRGEILALLGPSGCGKSTLLRIMAGLERPDRGGIAIEGRSVTELPPYLRPVNMMFQSYALFPHMSVEQNIDFGLRQAGMPREQREERIQRMLELVRMTAHRHRRPGQLSGGQQQRVALARSLAREPKLLLLDEPMGALDRKLRADMQFELGEILRRVGVTCMIVTHDPEEAMVMADRVALMAEGEVVQAGSPTEVYSRPLSRFAAEFLGAVNFLPATVTRVAAEGVTVAVPALGASLTAEGPPGEAPAEGREITLALRPEHFRLHRPEGGSGGAGMTVTVEDLAFLGTHTTYKVRAEGQVLAVHQPGAWDEQLDVGALARLEWDARAARLLLS